MATKTYDFPNPADIIAAVVFLSLCALIRPEVSGHRLVAFCIVLVDALIMFAHNIAPIGFLLVPLALIWFADVFGAFRGNAGHGGGVINTDTPGWMVAGFGWLALVAMSVAFIHEAFPSSTSQ